MKLLHTADLHLGLRWRGHSRRADQRRVLAEILELCDRHAVDLLLVAGDVFADRPERGHATVARELLEQMRPHLERGRAVCLLRGNHDPFDFFQLLRLLVAEAGGTGRWPLVVADLPRVYPVPGLPLQIVALPYLEPGRLQLAALDPTVTPDEQVVGLIGQLALKVERLGGQIDRTRQAIFAGHIHVTGASLSPEIEVEAGYHRELRLDPDRLPHYTAYNALGHIHLGQAVRGAAKPTWYAGAPDRLDLGERDYTPGVLLVTLPDRPGGVAEVEPIPLAGCTPFIRRELRGEDAVAALCAELPPGHDPLGEVTIADVPAHRYAALEGAIRTVAPRLHVTFLVPEIAPAERGAAELDPHDVPAVVRDYLARAFGEEPRRRERLQAAFDALWSEAAAEPGGPG